MTLAEQILLRELVNHPDKRIRSRGDSRLAFDLQAGGMAVIEILDDGARLKVTPTETGKRWVALTAAQQAARKVG